MERRRKSCTTTAVEVACRVQGRKGRATVYDVSCDGCMIDLNARVAAGDAVFITFADGIGIACKVLWAQGKQAGVQFDKPMHEAVVTHLGFSTAPTDTQTLSPRDHFGRPLPRLAARSHSSGRSWAR